VTPGVVVAPVLEVEPDTKNQEAAPSAPAEKRFNYGTVVFGAFSVLSLLVCLAKGIVPIYLGESVLWAAVAWYWQKKSPWSETATGIVLLVAAGVAGGEGYLLGRQSLGNNYTYLTQGNLQYRVNAGTGRTDRLDIRSGWVPVSFDRLPETITDKVLDMSNGSWANPTYGTNGEICFDVRNHLAYVIRDVTIVVSYDPMPEDLKSPKPFSFDSPPKIGDLVTLTREVGGLLDVGSASRFCGTAPRPFPTGAKWSYIQSSMTGWK
jgi:hypothetical protein